MNTVKELRKECRYARVGSSWTECDVVFAEMEVLDGGKSVFIACEWVSLAHDGVAYWANEKSTIDLRTKQELTEEEEKIVLAIQDKNLELYSSNEDFISKYDEQYIILKEMVRNKILEEGLFTEDEIDF